MMLATWGLAVVLLAAPVEPLATHTFAIVVASNRSATAGRNLLSYADDDAAKYFVMLSMFAAPGDVQLLTEFDADTRTLFPTLAPKPPTLAEVRAAMSATADSLRTARARGERTEVYFFFAGHGGVDHGQGFLELADQPLDSVELRQLLKDLPADTIHVVLDSCHSFFVVAPRKAGGKRYATPDDVAQALGDQLPNVGVVLSTSAENEVYEWSALQSGIFSHVVRSGASGAADSNQDGAVSYRELEAFIAVASRSIDNPLFRPKVFVRGPSGADATLFRPRPGAALRLSVDDPQSLRLSIRDARGLRWVDAHTEGGSPLTLSIPWEVARGMEVERRTKDATATRLLAPDELPAQLELGGLHLSSATRTARDANDQLQKLFDAPFGPMAFAEYQAHLGSEPPPVFGVSRSEALRLRTMVETFASVERDKRWVWWTTAASSSAFSLSSAIASAVSRPQTPWFQVTLSVSSAFSVLGVTCLELCALPSPSTLERLAARLTTEPDVSAPIRELDLALERIDRFERQLRGRQRALAYVGAGVSLAWLVVQEFAFVAQPPGDPTAVTLARISAVTGLVESVLFILQVEFSRGSAERLFHLWRSDPLTQDTLKVTVRPLDHGLTAGVSFTW